MGEEEREGERIDDRGVYIFSYWAGCLQGQRLVHSRLICTLFHRMLGCSKEVRKASLELDSQVLCCSLLMGLMGTVLSLGNPLEVLGAEFQ